MAELKQRIAELQEKAGMPLDQARELAMSERGITSEQIDEVAIEHFTNDGDTPGRSSWGPDTINRMWLEDIGRPFARAVLDDLGAQVNAPDSTDYKALYEDAMVASNEAGFAGMTAAETIRRLSADLDAAGVTVPDGEGVDASDADAAPAAAVIPLPEILRALRNEIDHAAINDLRLTPALGRVKGDPAIRASSIEAVVERFSNQPPKEAP